MPANSTVMALGIAIRKQQINVAPSRTAAMPKARTRASRERTYPVDLMVAWAPRKPREITVKSVEHDET